MTDSTVLLTGATGFIGRRLAPALAEDGHTVRAMTRHPEDYDGVGEPVGADVNDPDTLGPALEGVDVAIYLVHSLDHDDFIERDARAARAFGEAARTLRFGDAEGFLGLIDQVRTASPDAGLRSNVICGFPGETEQDVEVLADFVTRAQLDVLGVFGYSDEDGTEAESYADKLPTDEIEARVEHFRTLTEELNLQRAEERVGERLDVLVEAEEDEDGELRFVGRAGQQGPDVDGVTYVETSDERPLAIGDMVSVEVVATEGIDLVAEVR